MSASDPFERGGSSTGSPAGEGASATRDSTVHRVLRLAETRGGDTAFVQRVNGVAVRTTFRAYAEQCREFAGALIGEGLHPGDAVAIMGDNTPEWVIADVGAMAARAVPTGIYQTSTAEQVAYVAGHCEAKVLVLQHAGYWPLVASQRESLPHLRRVVVVRDAETIGDPLVVSFGDFLARGRGNLGAVEQRLREIEDGDPATLIYTSGTTGPPKGAMLSHANLTYMTNAARSVLPPSARHEVIVSYLPLSHIAEQMFTIHLPALFGATIVFAESLDKLKDALLDGRPTIFLGVPRVWEKVRAALDAKLREATGAKAAIIRWSRAVGLSAGRERLATGSMRLATRVRYALADRLFFSKLRKQLGLDRLVYAVSGAAPIALDVLEFFLSCGIVIHEVYGQTEGTGATTFNRPMPRGTRLGTVGPPLPGTEVRIAGDGEVLVRGPGVFLGYFKDPEATRATIVDGWLHSGDVGEFDADGFLRITDRKKDLLVTSGGKNVSPQNIEKQLKSLDGIAQAVVIGDRRHFVSALLTLNAARAPVLARERGWPEAPEELVRHEAFVAHVQMLVDGVNFGLARYERVRRFTLLAEDFSVERGELTPTQKIRRKVVAERYAAEIEAMYRGEGEVEGEGAR